MSDTSFQPGSTKGPAGSQYGASTFPGGPVINDGTSIDPGEPVTIFDESIKSQANNSATANVSGFALTAAEYPNRPILQFAGPLTLPAEVWSSHTEEDTGGLTPHAAYYLSPTTAGKITTTQPSGGGQFSTPVGFAHNATTLMIQIGSAVAVGL